MIGHKMQSVIEMVSMYPSQPKLFYARRVGPNGSIKYGYETVNRVIKAQKGKGLSTLLFPLQQAAVNA